MYRDLFNVFLGCYRYESKCSRDGLGYVLGMFSGCVRDVLGMFSECSRDVLGMLSGCSRYV